MLKFDNGKTMTTATRPDESVGTKRPGWASAGAKSASLRSGTVNHEMRNLP